MVSLARNSLMTDLGLIPSHIKNNTLHIRKSVRKVEVVDKLLTDILLSHADFTKNTKFSLSSHAGAGVARLRVRSAQRLMCVYS